MFYITAIHHLTPWFLVFSIKTKQTPILVRTIEKGWVVLYLKEVQISLFLSFFEMWPPIAMVIGGVFRGLMMSHRDWLNPHYTFFLFACDSGVKRAVPLCSQRLVGRKCICLRLASALSMITLSVWLFLCQVLQNRGWIPCRFRLFNI